MSLPIDMSENLYSMSTIIRKACEEGNYKLRLVFPFSVREQKEGNMVSPTAHFMGRKEEKSIFGECKSAVVFEKILASQKKMRAEEAKRKYLDAFCNWFEKKFALNAKKALLEYTKEDREALLHIFIDEHRNSSFADNLNKTRRKNVGAVKEMRECCEEMYPSGYEIESFLRWYR